MALKLTQYVRASSSKHPIGVIQQYCIEKLGYDNCIEQEFSRITDKRGNNKSSPTYFKQTK